MIDIDPITNPLVLLGVIGGLAYAIWVAASLVHEWRQTHPKPRPRGFDVIIPIRS
jgi:hypothetical protein